MDELWSEERRALWRRICAHRFEDPQQSLDFCARLAREQGWSRVQARAAIEEYRRFCFLAMVSGSMVTPSDAVDQVWHLHLSYSRDYWRQFCPQVLGADLHHHPTTGGSVQQLQHAEQYAATLAVYEDYFGTPPARWWPATHLLYEPGQRWRWVDSARCWMLPRPRWPRWPHWLGGALLLLPGVALALPDNPLDWRGGPFLVLYSCGLLLICLLSWLLRELLARSATPASSAPLGATELAFLAGGTARMTDALVAAGLSEGSLALDGKGLRSGSSSASGEQREVQMLVARGLKPAQLLKALRPMGERVGALLAQRGLVLNEAEGWRVRLASALPLWLWVAFGASKIAIGLERNKPVVVLVLLTIVCAVIALAVTLTRPRLSRAGINRLRAERLRHSRLRRAPRSDKGELALAVALGGTAVLATTAYAGYHEARAPSTSSDSSSGCSSSDSGGGGGGCGGCGGGD